MDKNFSKEYRKQYWKTYRRLFRKNLDWKAATAEVVPAVIGLFIFVRQYGWSGIMDNFPNFFWYVLSIPGALAIIYSTYIILSSHVEIYKNHKIELANLSWLDVEIEPFHFVDHGAHIAALRVRNNKPIKIIELNAVIQELWLDFEKIAEQKSLYWSGEGRLHHRSEMDVLCPNGGEGIIPVAIGTSKKAYVDDAVAIEVINDVKIEPKRTLLKRGIEYQINIVVFGKVESGAMPKPLPSFKGTIIYEPPKITIKPAT